MQNGAVDVRDAVIEMLKPYAAQVAYDYGGTMAQSFVEHEKISEALGVEFLLWPIPIHRGSAGLNENF